MLSYEQHEFLRSGSFDRTFHAQCFQAGSNYRQYFPRFLDAPLPGKRCPAHDNYAFERVRCLFAPGSIWLPQKQEGLFAVGIRVPLGDFYTGGARKLADLVKKYAGNEIRLTLRQDICSVIS